ncbi:hypothetical protein MUP77_07175 [Candidatus Bathyarchaeota archaeon]|nr:hypothetical protein [Candidatus Bathyarchaeota archaeon]
MEILDYVKRYDALTASLKKFAIIIVSSMTFFAAVMGYFEIADLRVVLERNQFLAISLFALLIPIAGFVAGVLFVRKKVNSVKTGEWKEELSQGFPSALKMLMNLDWDKTIDEISAGKISYAVYVIFKAATYWVITFFALNFVGNPIVFFLLQRPEFLVSAPWVGLAFLIVLLTLGNDIWARYKEILSMDMLLWELRWFSIEFRRAEFQT